MRNAVAGVGLGEGLSKVNELHDIRLQSHPYSSRWRSLGKADSIHTNEEFDVKLLNLHRHFVHIPKIQKEFNIVL